tara:strand:- start:2524 stop:4683 length:2160 start_codon:yes stop_codon:yes gene_type:complete
MAILGGGGGKKGGETGGDKTSTSASGASGGSGGTSMQFQTSINTISCPCSSYAIDLGNGNIGCEIDDFGILKSINPISISNHLINNKTPKVGDRWRCTKIKCEQGNFKWDTLHVVKVEENLEQVSGSLFNSIPSTSNCYIPPTTIGYYVENKIVDDYVTLGFINDVPLFETAALAMSYRIREGKELSFSEYNDEGVIKYFPGEYYPKDKFITGCKINKKDMLAHAYGSDWIYKSYASETNKITVDGKGGIIDFKVFGKNKPTFTITIKDSSGCSVLDKKIKNETLESDVYNLRQSFPALPQGKTSETYDFTLTPTADSGYYYNKEIIRAGTVKAKIWQFKDPVFTLTASNSTIANATTTQTDVTVTKKPNTRSQDTSSLTHTTTITRASGSDNYYVNAKSLRFSDLTTQNTWIKKTIIKQDEDGIPCVSSFKVTNNQNYFDSSDNLIYQGDIEIGMRFSGKIEKTKTIRKSIDLDIHKEPCDDCDDNTDIKTNKFEIDNTNDLFAGMMVKGINFITNLESVDCGKSITLGSEHVINKNTDITFSHVQGGTVRDIKGDLIETNCVRFPNNTELTFTKANKSEIEGGVTFDKSGSSSMTITSIINNGDFGQDDTTFTLDPDLFITNKPNTCDQHITIGKNISSYVIDFTKCDTDYNTNDKTVGVVDSFKNGTFALHGGAPMTRSTYTPNPNFVGKDRLVFTVATNDSDVASEEKTIFITVK